MKGRDWELSSMMSYHVEQQAQILVATSNSGMCGTPVVMEPHWLICTST